MGESAEQLHRQTLKHVLGVRGSTATPIALTEFGRYPFRFHWWQQIVQDHNRINSLPDAERLVQCAFVEGLHDQAYCFWSHSVQTWLQLQSTALRMRYVFSTVIQPYQSTYPDMQISADIRKCTPGQFCTPQTLGMIDNAKNLYRQAFHLADHNLGRY